MEHLIELRLRLQYAILTVIIVFSSMAFFTQELYVWLSKPLLDALPAGAQMIATDVASPFFAPFKLTFVLSIFVSIPVILYQIWLFLVPGLYKKEKQSIAPLFASISLLFYLGTAFAYYVIFPLALPFFVGIAPDGVVIATDINSYLNFALKLFFSFGMSFQIPVLIVILCSTNITTVEVLRDKRPYIVVAAFVVGMLLTPPDPISQVLLALPMWFLFEIGLVLGRISVRSKALINDPD